jgi:hypothetical protein
MYAENISIEDKTIYLDGATMHNCQIRRCKLVINGYMSHSLSDCHFDDCTWVFSGPASTVLQFLRQVNKAGASEMVNHIVKAILENESIPGVAPDMD